MSYRSIVLDLHEVETVETLVTVARALEEGESAHITGVHRVPTVDIQYQIAPLLPSELLKNLNQKHLDLAKAIHEKFSELAGSDEGHFSWHLHSGKTMTDISDAVAEAITADVVITSQLSNTTMPWLQRDLMEKSGAPVMVVPKLETPFSFDKVAIAWSGAVHTSRAVRDAMPLLERAKQVSVIRIGAEAKHDAHERSGSDIVAWLERHGCEVTLEPNDPEREHAAGTSLVEFVSNTGAGLLIAGGYGHSRFYDNVLGGMTDGIITHAKVPVLLSH